MSIFNQLWPGWESSDLEGFLQLESTVTRVVNERTDCQPADMPVKVVAHAKDMIVIKLKGTYNLG